MQGRNVLVLGGSRQVVEDMIALGWNVTTYNRGNTYWGEAVNAKINRVIGDREADFEFRAWLASVKEPWDAVVDFTSFQEEDIDQIVCGLKDRTKHYIFVSSDSTYNVCPVEEELAKLLSPESQPEDPFADSGTFILDSVLSTDSPPPAQPQLPPVRPVHKRTEESCVRPKQEWLIKKFRKKDTYGDNKLICEELLAYYYKDSQFPYTAIRIPDVFGPNDNTKRHWRYQMWLRCSNVQPVELSYFAHCQPLSFVFSRDVSSAIIQIINTGQSTFGQSYNFACEETPTLEEYLNLVAKIIGVEEPKYNFTERGQHVLLPSVDFGPISIDKAKKELKWKPTSLEEALKETCKWCDDAWYKFPEERKWKRFSEEAQNELKKVYEALDEKKKVNNL